MEGDSLEVGREGSADVTTGDPLDPLSMAANSCAEVSCAAHWEVAGSSTTCLQTALHGPGRGVVEGGLVVVGIVVDTCAWHHSTEDCQRT